MVEPTPQLPTTSSPTSGLNAVRVATPDLILMPDESVPIEIMTDLVFEDIGGHELINISRNDLINGQDVIYRPIKNLSSIFFQYNPQNIMALQKTSESYFRNFPIKLGDRTPDCGTGYVIIDDVEVLNCKIVYCDPVTGNLIINVINMGKEEQVEVQILQEGIVLSDTIYEVE
ncbi:hypothetical protein EBU71_10970 [bacterium]|jgi:hypothetical protein|nr:hypothetical protein [Candidatus Elulimicrobium humile]